MSENFWKVDDVTMELATVIDEYSAVDCYRMKKDIPLQLPSKKALSYKTILKSNYPGTSATDSKYKLPDSIDLDYLDVLSGKSLCVSKKEETKVPIRMESFEKLCYQPELTKSQKQAIIERELREQEALERKEETENLNIEETAGCSPCCFKSSKSDLKEDEENLEEVLLISDDEVEHEVKKEEGDELSERNEKDPLLPTESQKDPQAEVSSNEKPKKKTESSDKKKRKSVFNKLFFRKAKN